MTPTRDVIIEAGFALVHLLKRTGQLDEAVARLDDIARLAPGRAREAHLQIADIALARYDVTRALSHATAAAAAADPQTLARVGELQARAGADELAIATYRAAIAHDTNPAATLALARLLVRRGNEQEAADALNQLLRASHDDDAITRGGASGARARRPARADCPISKRSSRTRWRPARTRRHAAGCWRRCSSGFCRRCTATPNMDDARRALGRRVLRPLLEIVTEADQPPGAGDHRSDRHAGQRRRGAGAGAARDPGQGTTARGSDGAPRPERRDRRRAGNGGAAQRPVDRQLRGGARFAARGAVRARATRRSAGRPAFARYAGAQRGQSISRDRDLGPGPSLRRADGAGADQGARRPTGPTSWRPPVSGSAARRAPRRCSLCSRWPPMPAADRDATRRHHRPRPRGPRAAPPLATALSPALLELLDSGDPELAQAAAMALAWSRDPRGLFPLLARALLPHRFALARRERAAGSAGGVAGNRGAPGRSAASSPDRSGRRRRAAGRCRRPSPADLDAALARAHARIAGPARRRPRARRRRAPRCAGGARLPTRRARRSARSRPTPTPRSAPTPPPRSARSFSRSPTSSRRCSTTPDADTRATALRVLAKLGDERVTPARIAAAAFDAAPALAAAAALRRRPRHRRAARPGAGDRGRARAGAGRRFMAAPPGRGRCAGRCWARPGSPLLERTRADKHAVVRAAALDALAKKPF